MSLENLLDATLDDLADAPSIKAFPDGAHKVKLSFKLDLTKQSVQMKMTYVECVELGSPTEIAPEPGDVNVVFMNLKKKDGTNNEYAQGALKEIVKVLSPVFPGASTKAVLEAAEGCEPIVVTKVRRGTGDYLGKDQIDIITMSFV